MRRSIPLFIVFVIVFISVAFAFLDSSGVAGAADQAKPMVVYTGPVPANQAAAREYPDYRFVKKAIQRDAYAWNYLCTLPALPCRLRWDVDPFTPVGMWYIPVDLRTSQKIDYAVIFNPYYKSPEGERGMVVIVGNAKPFGCWTDSAGISYCIQYSKDGNGVRAWSNRPNSWLYEIRAVDVFLTWR